MRGEVKENKRQKMHKRQQKNEKKVVFFALPKKIRYLNYKSLTSIMRVLEEVSAYLFCIGMYILLDFALPNWTIYQTVQA